MKIYLIGPAGNYEEFAQFAAVGTWVQVAEPCDECTATGEDLGAPLQIEWEPGSTEIGDFAWDGGYVCVVQPRVRRFFREHGFKCRFLPVEHVPPSGRVRKREKRVAVPYTGPELRWLHAVAIVELNEKKSHVRVESQCPQCGRIEKTFKREGIVIDRQSWPGCHIFRIAQNEPSEATFVTDELRKLLLAEGFTNIDFTEAGCIARR